MTGINGIAGFHNVFFIFLTFDMQLQSFVTEATDLWRLPPA